MTATVIFDDFMGTVAADVSDHTTLDVFLSKLGVDMERYKAVSVDFSSAYNKCATSIICLDKDNSAREKPHYVRISLSSNMKYEDFFILFKRFKIVMQDRFHHDDIIDEEIVNLPNLH